MLIGAELFFDLLREGQIRHKHSGPTLQNTVFGWVASGPYKENPPARCISYSTLVATEDNNLDHTLRKFWEIERIPDLTKSQLYTPDQVLSEKSFASTVSRDSTGKFVVSLPFKSSPSCLGSSYETARRRFLSLERRMKGNPTNHSLYIQFMKEYLALGHMEATDNRIPNEPHYFIPHQCVLRPESSSTKLRVVFDASCKTTSQISLNEILLVGPTIQPCLYATLLKFRFHKFAMSADITKMYRQVVLDETHRKFQLIVWRENPQDPLQIYRLNTVTYGTASAPFLAIRCLKQLSEIYSESLPLASQALANDFYVDDLLTGADSIRELRKLRGEITEILDSAGFVLAKWASNCNPNERQVAEPEVLIGEDADTKTLGLTWSPKQDTFKFNAQNLQLEDPPTKRSMLSFAARLFDPLGLICPIVTLAKIFIQKLWSLQIGWDDEIPATYCIIGRRCHLALQI